LGGQSYPTHRISGEKSRIRHNPFPVGGLGRVTLNAALTWSNDTTIWIQSWGGHGGNLALGRQASLLG
jgi:hypothetical protein